MLIHTCIINYLVTACGGEFEITDEDPVVDLFFAPGMTYATNALCQWVVRGRPGSKLVVEPIFTNTGKVQRVSVGHNVRLPKFIVLCFL